MPLAKVAAWAAGWPAEGIAALARTGAGLPGAEIDWPGSWGGALLLAFLIATALLLGTRLHVGRHPWLCAACVLLVVLAVVRPVPLVRPFTGWPPPGWRLVACDVGQGDALALATGRDGIRPLSSTRVPTRRPSTAVCAPSASRPSPCSFSRTSTPTMSPVCRGC